MKPFWLETVRPDTGLVKMARCLWCRKKFIPVTSNGCEKKYCCKACARAFRHQKWYEKNKKPCKVCKTTLVGHTSTVCPPCNLKRVGRNRRTLTV